MSVGFGLDLISPMRGKHELITAVVSDVFRVEREDVGLLTSFVDRKLSLSEILAAIQDAPSELRFLLDDQFDLSG